MASASFWSFEFHDSAEKFLKMSQVAGKRIFELSKYFRSDSFESGNFTLRGFSQKQVFSHLEEVSDVVVVEQKLLCIRLIAAVVNVLVEVSLQTQEGFSYHARVVGVELDSFDQNTLKENLMSKKSTVDACQRTHVLWKSAICWKFIKIKSLLSRTSLGILSLTFLSGLSIVLMYRSTTVCRSFPNSSSVSTNSRITALQWKIVRISNLNLFYKLTLVCKPHHQLCHQRVLLPCAGCRALPLVRSLP